jgi:hypothetical protein
MGFPIASGKRNVKHYAGLPHSLAVQVTTPPQSDRDLVRLFGTARDVDAFDHLDHAAR